MGVVHISFVDDLLMFSKAKLKLIHLLQEAFARFSTASGLQASPEKSSLYMVGVKPQQKQELLQALGYREG